MRRGIVASALTRILLVAALLVALVQPAVYRMTDRIFAVYLVDVSDSVSDASLEMASRAVADGFAAKLPEDEIRVVVFAKEHHLLDADVSHRPIARPPSPPPPGSDEREGGATDLAAAVRFARGLLPEGYVKRIVLLSDGLETRGAVEEAVPGLREDHVSLYTQLYEGAVRGEVAVESLHADPGLKAGDVFTLHAKLFSTYETRALVSVRQGDAPNTLDAEVRVELHPGENDVPIKSVVKEKGDVTYAVSVSEMPEDQFPANNVARATFSVNGPPRVLDVQGGAVRPQYLARALRAQGLDVLEVVPEELATHAKRMDRFDFAILEDVPAPLVSPVAKEVEAFVRSGGGLLVTFGNGMTGSPLLPLLPVSVVETASREEPSVAMSLVIDRSGSMSGVPIEMAKAAARAAAETLAKDDLIEVIAFDSAPSRVVRLTPAGNSSSISNDIARIRAGGGTAIRPALIAAYQSLSSARARRKHVLLLTDGEAPAAGIRELVSAMFADAITVSSIGLGADIDDNLLRMIAGLGGGRYYKVTEPSALPRVFTRETEVVARRPDVETYSQAHVRSSAPFLRGLAVESSPPLHGYVSARMKSPPAELVLSVGEKGDPLLARWHVGLGWSLAFTSDTKSRWGVEWITWPKFGPLFAQLVREHMRPRQKGSLPLILTTDDRSDRVTAIVDAVGEDDEFEDDFAGKIRVEPPEGAGRAPSPFELPLRHTAPGRYEAEFDARALGSYRVSAHLEGANERSMDLVGHTEHSYPREYTRFVPDAALMQKLASETGGAPTAAASQVLSPHGETARSRRELWPLATFAALVLLLFDVGLRRRMAR